MPPQARAERGLAKMERMQRWERRRWPRGPQLDIVREAEAAIREAAGRPRRKAEVPSRVEVLQLSGCQPLDWRVIRPLPQDRPLRVLELFADVGAATQALVRLGYSVGEVIACEVRGAARQVHRHAMGQLAKEFPDRCRPGAAAQLHHRLPQDIRLVSSEHLQALGPIDLVVAGWPCQGNSAAGGGAGLDDRRSGLLAELIRVLQTLQALHARWRHPMGYLVEHVAAGTDRRPKVREHYAAARGLLGPEILVDAAQLGSRAHRLRAWWTNLEGIPLLRAAIGCQTRPAGFFVHQVLGPGRQARRPQVAGTAPWAKVERPGEERKALNTFVSYKGSYAFSRGGGGCDGWPA